MISSEDLQPPNPLKVSHLVNCKDLPKNTLQRFWCEAYLAASSSTHGRTVPELAGSSVGALHVITKSASAKPECDQRVTSLDGAALHATLFCERGTGSNAKAENDINSEDFNQFTLRDTELVPTVIGVFKSLNVCQGMGVTTEKLASMVQKGMSLYHNQPYHNFRHAFDVFQATNVLLRGTGLVEVASDVEIFSLLVAALLHDVGHPGLTNDFHEKEATPYAVLARSKHVGSSSNAFKANEHCHREITQQLLLGENGLLKLDGDVSVPSASRVESLVQHLILATDPSTQGAFLKRLDDRMTEGLDWNSPDDRVLVWSLIIRSADVFHPIRPFRLHQQWALRIDKEFAQQAKLESVRRGVPPPKPSTLLGKGTIGFLNFLVIPLVDRLTRLVVVKVPTKLAFVTMLSQRLKMQHQVWSSYDKLRELRGISSNSFTRDMTDMSDELSSSPPTGGSARNHILARTFS